MRVEAEFPATMESAGAARRFAQRTLDEWNCPQLIDTVQLLVSELVSNALLHAQSPATVGIALDGATLRVEVHDRSPVLPQVQHAPPTADSGRGLMILDTLADAWGVSAEDDAKTVWFELGASSVAS